jgi:surface antigen
MLPLSRSKPLIAMLVLTTSLTACTGTNQNEIGGALTGALGGGIACMLAKANPALCAVLVVAGAFIGGAIGQKIDERDKAARQAAIQQALADKTMWANVQTAAPPPSASATSTSANAAGWSNPDTADASNWHNPDTGNSGEITPVSSYSDPATGQLCHDYMENYTRNGQTISQPTKACQGADGQWNFTYLSSSGT